VLNKQAKKEKKNKKSFVTFKNGRPIAINFLENQGFIGSSSWQEF
jgi:hypothetical protein